MSQKLNFFFSIIIPVYNTENYLAKCLNSIVKQSFGTSEVQVIVVNDGSPKKDECDKIVHSYKDKLHINYVRLETNQGLFFARKRGVEEVLGSYFLHLDSDDYLEKKALALLYEDIQNNGYADYIEFNYYILTGKFKCRRPPLSSCKSLKCDNFLWHLDANHTIWNKCFSTSFAKKIYSNMPSSYVYYSEDYYQMGVIQIFVKKKRILEKSLYIYVQEVGITGVKKYSQEKLRKIILSIYNVNKHLSEFYKQENYSHYIPLVQNYSETLYAQCIFNSSLKDFIDTSKDISQDIIKKTCLNNIITKYLSMLHENTATYKKREKLLFPMIMFFSFIFNSPKKNKKMMDITKIIDDKTGTLKDTATRNDIFEYIFYLEEDLLFYKKRSKYYAPLKFFLRPFLHIYNRVFER